VAENGIVKNTDVLRENLIPPEQRPTALRPVLHHSNIPQIDIDNWAQ
jgi:hypothetical protein